MQETFHFLKMPIFDPVSLNLDTHTQSNEIRDNPFIANNLDHIIIEMFSVIEMITTNSRLYFMLFPENKINILDKIVFD